MRTLLLLVLCLPGVVLGEGEHFPTFDEFKTAHAFPKWATTVCFSEKSTNEQMLMEDEPWNARDATAVTFLLYGPKGDLGIQTEEYAGGKAIAYAIWERQKDSPGASNFMSITLGKNHHESTLMKLQLQWQPKPYFYIELSSTNTGRPIMKAEGRCQPI